MNTRSAAAPPAWRAWRAAARRREAAIALLWALPACVLATVLAWRLGGIAWTVPAIAGLAGRAAIALRVRRVDDAALARRLDAAHPGLEDSAALLRADAAALDPLARLQQARLHARLHAPPVRRRRAVFGSRRRSVRWGHHPNALARATAV